ncbi:methyltransferase [Kitasatospora atroaurantiaca]|nr:methyltransferase [Kitasatospora atroaurantiaca]
MDPEDLKRIEEAVGFIRANDTGTVLAELIPGLGAEDRATVAAHCRFTHAAVLVFPETLAELREDLRDLGLAVGETTASVVVRDRLSRRYGRPGGSLEVGILRAPVRAGDGRPCELEIFALVVPPGSGLEDIVRGERAENHEAHLAFAVGAPDGVVLAGLRSMLVDRGRMVVDGGGYNAHEDGTVLYFASTDDLADGGPVRPYRRLELHAQGRHTESLAAQHREPEQPGKQLLQLMTGAWVTQAIAVAAELGLADQLAAPAGVSTEQLADRTGADHGSLLRLLRYLAGLGVVTPYGDSYRLTEIGQLLRTDVEHSMHPLARLYGGSFYESFGQLIHAVRTGREAFEHLFGKNHFDHFAEHPELAELFDRAMASSAAMFGPVVEGVDFSGARVVVDVAGGNGELLSRILRASPHLRGVLLERSHVIAAARGTMAKAGLADRCRFVVGDFTSAVPEGGDVYLLSRVLHDWDDRQCLAILERCAEAMPAGAELLIVERLLPEDDSPSLAVAWDVHMMCNVGGRERTADHYRRLLAAAGFDLTTWSELPLDGALLRARKR